VVDEMEDRFWPKVSKGPICWEWTASVDGSGYGQFRSGGRGQRAHRVAFEDAHGPIPEGMLIDHICANRRCVNPAHLRLANTGQNSQYQSVLRTDNTSGARGVSWNKRKKKWQVHIRLNGHKKWIGYYAELQDADRAAREARAHYFDFPEFKEMA